jgi:hypothetical protein
LSGVRHPSRLAVLRCAVSIGTVGPVKHEFKFLSRHAALLLALSAFAPEFLIHAAEHGLDYQLTEAFLSALLLRDSSMEEEWRTSWEWHGDARRHIKFPGTYYEGDAQELEGDALYISQTINFRLGEMFMAVKENGRTVAINMFQTTTKALPDRPFPVATLEATMKRLWLFKPHNTNVTLNLICLVDNRLAKVRSLKFKVNDTVNGKVEVKDMTVDELRQAHPEVGNRLKTFVVRTGLYYFDRAKIISLPLSQLEFPQPVDVLLSETKRVLIEMANTRKIERASKMTNETLVVM